jgi:GT2 family glycosyltransferase
MLYPTNEIVIVYDGIMNVGLGLQDENLIEVNSENRIYVGGGYNLALKHSTKKCFVFLHDDTFVLKNFLENIIPHVSEKIFCNFTTIEPPLYNDPDTLGKPIRDFGRNMDVFDIKKLYQFYDEHIQKIQDPTIDSPFGGSFMAGFKESILSVDGFDEYFKPYFYEDADLMFRLRSAGYNFIHVLGSIVYHMGSMTARGTPEEQEAIRTTANLFIKKWKASWEYMKLYTMSNGIEYKKIPVEIIIKNGNPQLESFVAMINEPNSDMQVHVDGHKLNQTDVGYLQSLPYVLQSVTDEGTYALENLTVTYKKRNSNV